MGGWATVGGEYNLPPMLTRGTARHTVVFGCKYGFLSHDLVVVHGRHDFLSFWDFVLLRGLLDGNCLLFL